MCLDTEIKSIFSLLFMVLDEPFVLSYHDSATMTSSWLQQAYYLSTVIDWTTVLHILHVIPAPQIFRIGRRLLIEFEGTEYA